MSVRISGAARQAAMNAIAALLNTGGAGTLRVYSGGVPATPDTAASGTLLAELPLSNPAFANADGNGQAVGNSVTDDADPLAAGVIGYVRLVNGSNVAVMDLEAGLTGSGQDIEFDSLNVQLNVPVRVTQLILQHPGA